MFRSVLIATLLATAYAGILPRLDGRIVGGDNANIRDFPYQLSLQFLESHICGATIIASRWAITAAHCTDGTSSDLLTLLAGISNLKETGQRIMIRKIHQHPKYSSSNLDYDISVLELDDEIIFDDTKQPIGLPFDGNEPVRNSIVHVSGWGAPYEGGFGVDDLQSVEVAIVDRNACREKYGNSSITERMICAGAPDKDSCQGDSGGPLVGDGKLLGVVSWGYGCASPDYPGVYSHVAELRSFIREVSQL